MEEVIEAQPCQQQSQLPKASWYVRLVDYLAMNQPDSTSLEAFGKTYAKRLAIFFGGVIFHFFCHVIVYHYELLSDLTAEDYVFRLYVDTVGISGLICCFICVLYPWRLLNSSYVFAFYLAFLAYGLKIAFLFGPTQLMWISVVANFFGHFFNIVYFYAREISVFRLLVVFLATAGLYEACLWSSELFFLGEINFGLMAVFHIVTNAIFVSHAIERVFFDHKRTSYASVYFRACYFLSTIIFISSDILHYATIDHQSFLNLEFTMRHFLNISRSKQNCIYYLYYTSLFFLATCYIPVDKTGKIETAQSPVVQPTRYALNEEAIEFRHLGRDGQEERERSRGQVEVQVNNPPGSKYSFKSIPRSLKGRRRAKSLPPPERSISKTSPRRNEPENSPIKPVDAFVHLSPYRLPSLDFNAPPPSRPVSMGKLIRKPELPPAKEIETSFAYVPLSPTESVTVEPPTTSTVLSEVPTSSRSEPQPSTSRNADFNYAKLVSEPSTSGQCDRPGHCTPVNVSEDQTSQLCIANIDTLSENKVKRNITFASISYYFCCSHGGNGERSSQSNIATVTTHVLAIDQPPETKEEVKEEGKEETASSIQAIRKKDDSSSSVSTVTPDIETPSDIIFVDSKKAVWMKPMSGGESESSGSVEMYLDFCEKKGQLLGKKMFYSENVLGALDHNLMRDILGESSGSRLNNTEETNFEDERADEPEKKQKSNDDLTTESE